MSDSVNVVELIKCENSDGGKKTGSVKQPHL